MAENVQSCFELSIHFPVFFSCKVFLVAVHGWFAIQTNGCDKAVIRPISLKPPPSLYTPPLILV